MQELKPPLNPVVVESSPHKNYVLGVSVLYIVLLGQKSDGSSTPCQVLFVIRKLPALQLRSFVKTFPLLPLMNSPLGEMAIENDVFKTGERNYNPKSYSPRFLNCPRFFISVTSYIMTWGWWALPLLAEKLFIARVLHSENTINLTHNDIRFSRD